ncbi:zinc finger protein 189 isoform X3 [Larimichthys crocea]|uniref:zinc finger protein 189 isoform X3 n=1 Tax=Larimichthys crocea TaxID=215358 RepID=UPI000F5ED6C0|nr:zinc finger protein 189 isoform X3 [Larimichthys crocea]
MDAASREGDRAGDRPHGGDTASENNVGSSSEDTGDGVGVFCCRDCGEAFREEAAFLEHCHQHPQETVYLDDQLDDLHEAEKDSETANFCTFCSLSFDEPNEFHLHMENHGHTSQKGSTIQINSGISKQHTYECPDCGKCYGVLGHFLNHQRSHKQAAKSVFHDLEHLKKKSFQCESCGRNYSRASALDAHRRCHEEKLIKSRNRGSGDACHTEESTVEAKPSENQTDDTPEKLFKCLCGKAFTALMRLKTHQRFSRNRQCSPEEMKEKPKKNGNEFYCSQCNKGFTGHIALFNHQRWHANHSNDSAKRFPCEECGKEFMTLTFYYRHQRMVHSNETPAKSFLHQVCQLQKKAFECKDCGLKFSRASALHSHQLHHTDVFKESEKESQTQPTLQEKTLESETTKETKQEPEEPESLLSTNMAEEDSHVNETDEDMDSYEPGDFNVQVISASESEDEPVQDLNPDLELLCESDQEVRDDDDDTGVFSGSTVSKPEMDLKIVQIDFEQADMHCAPIVREAENKTTEERFDCPECYRWFSSASSLRVHRMWHGIHKRRQQTQVNQLGHKCEDCGLKFTDPEVFVTHLHQHALEEEEEVDEEGAQMGDNRSPAAEPQGAGVASMNQKQRQIYTCSVCGKVYTYLESFRKHQQLHEKQPYIPPKAFRYHASAKELHKHECPECGMAFIRRARLRGHLRVHKSPKSLKSKQSRCDQRVRKSYKSLKSKQCRCDQCNKNFTSVTSWMAHIDLHKQRPFWCLSCAKGFVDEGALDRHLQGHRLRKHACSVCHKRFRWSAQLTKHSITHTEWAKPFQCTICKKSFSFPGNLIVHRKKHHRVYAGSSRMPQNIRRKKGKFKHHIISKTQSLTSVREEPEMEELATQKQWEEAELWDHTNSEESDCGEPFHHFNSSEPPGSAGSDPHDEWKSETGEPQAGQKMSERESQETHRHREHKYWEWECCECDMGFDEVAKLHLHYIKHATGELPIPQDITED